MLLNHVNRYKSVYLFLALTAMLSTLFDLGIILLGHGDLHAAQDMYMNGLMWSPGLAGFLAAFILKIPIASFGWKWGKSRYQFQSFILPGLYILAAYLVIWIAGWGIFYDHGFYDYMIDSYGMKGMPSWLFIPILFVSTSLFFFCWSASNAIGEEVGWRGFLYSQLEGKLGFTGISIVTGVIWTAWHIPVIIWTNYNNGAAHWYGISCFALLVMSLSFIFTWFRMKSGSIWTGVILHASHNMYRAYLFEPMTGETAKTKFYGGEFGIALPIVCLLLALWFWKKRHRLTSQDLKSD